MNHDNRVETRFHSFISKFYRILMMLAQGSANVHNRRTIWAPTSTEKRTRAAKDCVRANLFDTDHQGRSPEKRSSPLLSGKPPNSRYAHLVQTFLTDVFASRKAAVEEQKSRRLPAPVLAGRRLPSSVLARYYGKQIERLANIVVEKRLELLVKIK